MSAESCSALDEAALRALLDKTLDLDERRVIRSALRELRRREIEDMEAALASKRFRPTRLRMQEDKENQQGSDSAGALGLLSGKLQSIQDLDELTKLLRGASEYEERRMIRAAIHRLRDEEQEMKQGSERGKAGVHILEPGSLEPQCTMGTAEAERETLGEREPIQSQIRELRGQPTQQGREPHRSGPKSGMVLVLDPLVKEMALGLTRPQLESVAQESDLASTHLQDLASVLPMAHHPDPVAPEQSQAEPSAGRPRSDSRASDESQSSERSAGSRSRPRTDSGASDSSGSPRPRLGTGNSVDSGGPSSRKRVDSGVSSEGRDVEVPMSCSPSSMDEAVTDDHHGHPRPSSSEITDQEQPDGAFLAKPVPGSDSGLLNGSAGGQTDVQQQKAPVSRDPPFSARSKAQDSAVDQKEEGPPAAFSRTNSVRDRMRKFTEPSAPAPRKTPVGNGTPFCLGQRNTPRAAALFEASLDTRGDEPGRPCIGSASFSAPASQTSGPPGDVARKPQPGAGQSHGSVGGATGSPDEKSLPVPGEAQEESTPAAGEQDLPGDEEADMKTFLTIEIKDGRTATSSASSSSAMPTSRGNTVPITHMAPLITATGQRAELTLGLRATPFKMSSSSLTSASSFKMETEPVMASEPVGPSVGPSIHGSFRAPAVPNGSSSTTSTTSTTVAQPKPVEHSGGKLSEAQLAAIEDEELLDRMLDESKDFEERRLIRAAMRDLRKRKRDQREKERDGRLQQLRQQREERGQAGRGSAAGGGAAAAGETVVRKVEKSADGSTHSQVTKTDRFAKSDDGSRSTRTSLMEASYVQKTDRGTVQSKSYSFSSSSSMSSSAAGTPRKVGR